MATYKIGPLSIQGDSIYDARRPLTCERCHAVIAAVWSVAEYSHLPAERVWRKWPEVDEAVRRHETVCQSPEPAVPARSAGPAGAVAHAASGATIPDYGGASVLTPTSKRLGPAGDTKPILLNGDTKPVEPRARK